VYFIVCASGIDEVMHKTEYLKNEYKEAKYNINPQFTKFIFLRHIYGAISTSLICFRINRKLIIPLFKDSSKKLSDSDVIDDNWIVKNNKKPNDEMMFGEDIYALAVAILHKKNAKHLKYYDENEK
jgi:hypothetical protein